MPVATPKHHQSQKGADNSHLMWLILHGVGLRSVYTAKEVVWISKDRMKLRRLISFKWYHLIASIIISTHAHTPAYTNTSRTHTYTHTHTPTPTHTHPRTHTNITYTHHTYTHQKHTHVQYISLPKIEAMSYIFSAVANGACSQGNQLQNNMQECQISRYIMLKAHGQSTEGCGTATIDSRSLTSQKVGGYVTF